MSLLQHAAANQMRRCAEYKDIARQLAKSGQTSQARHWYMKANWAANKALIYRSLSNV